MNKRALLKLHLIVHFSMVLLFLLIVYLYGPARFTYQISQFLPLDNRLKQNIEREYYKNHYSSLNKKEARGGIVFLGNSIIYRYPLEDHFSDHHVINRGIVGDTTGGVLERLDSNVLNLSPSKIFIMVGLNDIQIGLNKEQILKNYDNIIRQIGEKSPDTHIYIKSLLPLPVNGSKLLLDSGDGKYSKEFSTLNSINRSLATFSNKYRSVEYIDIYRLLVTSNGLIDQKYTDGKELNATAYTVMSNELKKYIGINSKVIEFNETG